MVDGAINPWLFVLMLIAYLINIVVRAVLERVGFYRLVWHRSIFDLGIYVFVLAAAVIAMVFCGWRGARPVTASPSAISAP